MKKKCVHSDLNESQNVKLVSPFWKHLKKLKYHQIYPNIWQKVKKENSWINSPFNRISPPLYLHKTLYPMKNEDKKGFFFPDFGTFLSTMKKNLWKTPLHIRRVDLINCPLKIHDYRIKNFKMFCPHFRTIFEPNKKNLGKKTLLKTIGRAPPHIGYNKLSIVNKWFSCHISFDTLWDTLRNIFSWLWDEN